ADRRPHAVAGRTTRQGEGDRRTDGPGRIGARLGEFGDHRPGRGGEWPMRRFNDPDDRNRPPEDLTAWLAAGMRRVDALAWRRWNFTLADAKQWRAAGINE